MKIPEFISDIQCKVAKLTGGNITSVNLRAIEGSIERLKQINEQLNVQKYRLVFIGEPGSGKTTTICNFLKLTIDAEVGDQFDRVELFETAQGRTTAAEVHFQRADRTAMVVYPMDISQQKAIVKEYCSYIWNEVFPNENEGDDQDANEDNTPDTSIEIETIICNMLGYESEDDFLDYVLEEYSGDGLDDFINET
ncbi:MAG: hypothetical protein IJ906_07905, partial [Oscillospiraceae bacterium]|nr:hypothetical protein [Oscillospiraceae bacterium]